MKKNTSRWRAYLLFHLALALTGLLCFLYAFVTARFFPPSFYHCPMHDLLHLYCPFCGGTRALRALAQLRFAEAFCLSPVCLSFVPVAAVLDIRALILLCRGSHKPLLPRGACLFLAVWLIGGTGLRNVLMLFGVEYTGELYAFWEPLLPAAPRIAAGVLLALITAGLLAVVGKPLLGHRANK